MNPMTGQEPLATIQGYNGLYDRGLVETCPPDHLADCWNCIFPGKSQIDLREPVTITSGAPVSVLTGTTIIAYFIAEVASGAALLTLSSDGKFYDETHAVLLGTYAGADDFAAINLFQKTYITLKANSRAYAFQGLMVYYYSVASAAYVLRTVAASNPAAAVTLAQPLAGNVDIGTHKIAVCFVDETGVISIPSPVASIASTGVNNIRVTNIPLGTNPGIFGGPAVVGRVLVGTKANQLELFFIPGGAINDNVTVTIDLNFFDTSLISSADYLNDLVALVPAGSALRSYNGRLVLIGQYGAPNQILFSDQLIFGSFNKIDGAIQIGGDPGINACNTGAVIRDTLYIMKPNGTYATQDTGNVPATWSVTLIDSGLGAFDTGMSIYANAMSGQDVFDTCIMAHKSGLRIFDGRFSDPPLTWKIEGLWQKIKADYFYKVRVAHDTWLKRVYIAVPLLKPSGPGGVITASADNENHILLMMDYQDGLDPKSVKWSTWYTASSDPIRGMSMENFTLTYTGVPQQIYQLAFCTGTAWIFKITGQPIVPLKYQADVAPATGTFVAINQYIITAPFKTKGGVYVFTMLDLSVAGSGSMGIKLWNKDRSGSTTTRPFDLSTYAGKDLQRAINFTNEGIQIQLQCDQVVPATHINGTIQLSQIDVYGTKLYNMRPALTEST